MTVPEVATPAPSAPPVAPPEPPPAPPAPPEENPAPQKPAGDPRPRSQRTSAPPPAPAQGPPAPVTPPAPATPPPAPQEPDPPAPPTPPPPPTNTKTPEQIIQEHEAAQAAEAARIEREQKLSAAADLFRTAPLKVRDMLLDTDTPVEDFKTLVEDLASGGLEAAKIVAMEEARAEANIEVQRVLSGHQAFMGDVVDSFFSAVPESLHATYQAAVDGKAPSVFVSELLKLAPELPEVRAALLEQATTLARELVPEANRADFETELGKASKDLKGVLHAAFQSGFLTGSDAPAGARTPRESGPGGLDVDRWLNDRSWRKTLSREENNRYHAEVTRRGMQQPVG